MPLVIFLLMEKCSPCLQIELFKIKVLQWCTVRVSLFYKVSKTTLAALSLKCPDISTLNLCCLFEIHIKNYITFSQHCIFLHFQFDHYHMENQAGALCLSRHHTPLFFLPYFLYSSVAVLHELMCRFKAF